MTFQISGWNAVSNEVWETQAVSKGLVIFLFTFLLLEIQSDLAFKVTQQTNKQLELQELILWRHFRKHPDSTMEK